MAQLSAERLWNTWFGPEEAYSPNEIPLVVSLCYYATTMVFGRILRALNSAIVPKSLQDYVADVILTFQVCACSLENIMLRRSYGVGGYALILFTLSTWFTFTVKEGRGNPCANVIDYVSGGQGFFRTVVRVALQLAGGLLSYRYARSFWALELTAGHGRRFRTMHCTAGLSVPSPIGFGLETGATFLESLFAITTITPFYVCETLSKAVICVIMTCLGVHMTGMYLNPANASTQEFGCHGVNGLDHVLVYWAGPMLAAVLATLFKRQVQELTKTMPTQEVPTRTQKDNVKKIQENGQESPSRKSVKNRFYQGKKQNSPKKAAFRKNARKEKAS